MSQSDQGGLLRELGQLFRHPKLWILGLAFAAILPLDIITKRWALETLWHASMPDFLGGRVPLTLAFNKGAAFGLSVGDDSRWLFVPLSIVAIAIMGWMYVRAEERDWMRLTALPLVVAGAAGNLYDRVRWDLGVVDFIGPVDLGFMLWPIFNVADMSISCGAVLLALSFWFEDRRASGRTEEEPREATA